MLPSTAERVPLNTCENVNQRIREHTDATVAEVGSRSRAAIDARIDELDQEWDVERMIEANASTVCLVGLGLGTFVDKRFYALPAVVAGFLLQHALQGWCPPIPILRRLGFRTQSEIEEERYALKAIRGDFEGARGVTGALRAVRA
jgi:hypothetical protein